MKKIEKNKKNWAIASVENFVIDCIRDQLLRLNEYEKTLHDVVSHETQYIG